MEEIHTNCCCWLIIHIPFVNLSSLNVQTLNNAVANHVRNKTPQPMSPLALDEFPLRAGNSSALSAYQSANQRGQRGLHSAFSLLTLYTSNGYDLYLSRTLSVSTFSCSNPRWKETLSIGGGMAVIFPSPGRVAT